MTRSQLLTKSRHFSHVMEPEMSLPLPQETATSPHPEPDESCPRPPILFFKICLNTILPSIPRRCKWSPSFRFSNQNPVPEYKTDILQQRFYCGRQYSRLAIFTAIRHIASYIRDYFTQAAVLQPFTGKWSATYVIWFPCPSVTAEGNLHLVGV